MMTVAAATAPGTANIKRSGFHTGLERFAFSQSEVDQRGDKTVKCNVAVVDWLVLG